MIFLLAKSARYFYDAEAVREDSVSPEQEEHNQRYAREYERHTARAADTGQPGNVNNVGIHSRPGPGGRNLRSVWSISTEPNGLAACDACDAYWERGAPREHCSRPVVAHYAAFPQALVERCIKASTSERGVCPECGAPWVRVVEASYEPSDQGGPQGGVGDARRDPGRRTDLPSVRLRRQTSTLGWQPSCECLSIAGMHAPLVPATVLDPFVGSGTTLLVARRLGRRGIGVELNERYCHMTSRRLSQLSLLA